jgi:hypothetical protein
MGIAAAVRPRRCAGAPPGRSWDPAYEPHLLNATAHTVAISRERSATVEALIVPRIQDDAPILHQDHDGAFVFEAPEGYSLLGHEVGVIGADLDHSVEAKGLVGFLHKVEPGVKQLPPPRAGTGREAIKEVRRGPLGGHA